MSKDNDVLIPEIIEDVELESTITAALQKHNVTESVIASLKEKYGDLRLKSIDDKENYLIIKESKREVRKWGILCEKITKKGREESIKVQKLWLKKEKEILGKIAEVEDPLQAEIDRYEAEEERKATEEIKRKENQYMQRQHALLKMGAVYDNDSFTLNGISYEANVIKEADQDIWESTMLAKYQREFEKIEVVRIAEENRRKEEEARMIEERAELAKLRQQQAEREQQLRDQQAAIDKQQREIREAEEKKQKEKTDLLRAQRTSQLNALGLMYNGTEYFFDDINVHWNEIVTKTDDEWNKMIEDISPIIEDKKADAEVKRLAEIERQKNEFAEQAAKKERERIEEQQRQDELKKQHEEVRKAEELAQASDKIKWESVIGYLTAYKFPEFKSPAYKRKAQIAKEKIEDIEEL